VITIREKIMDKKLEEILDKRKPTLSLGETIVYLEYMTGHRYLPRTICTYIKDGKITANKLSGRRYIITKESVNKFIGI
jgi:hypothetical protein